MTKNRKENFNNLSNLSYSITKNLTNVFIKWYSMQLDSFSRNKIMWEFQILVLFKTFLCHNNLKSKVPISEQ